MTPQEQEARYVREPERCVEEQHAAYRRGWNDALRLIDKGFVLKELN